MARCIEPALADQNNDGFRCWDGASEIVLAFQVCRSDVISHMMIHNQQGVQTMAINNQVILIGNLGQKPTFHQDKNSKEFAVLTLCTQDSYQPRNSEEWVEAAPIWHTLYVRTEKGKALASQLDKGDRIKVEASLDYQKKTGADGYDISEAALSAYLIELAPLAKKSYVAAKTAAPEEG